MTVKQRALPVRSYSINQRRNRFMFVRAETYIARCAMWRRDTASEEVPILFTVTQQIQHKSPVCRQTPHLTAEPSLLDSHFSINYNHSTSSVDVSSHNIRPLSVRGVVSRPCSRRDTTYSNLRPCKFVNKSIETRFYFTINTTLSEMYLNIIFIGHKNTRATIILQWHITCTLL